MSCPRAMQVAFADTNFLSSNGWRLPVPATGRTKDNAAGGYLEVIIYSITLSVNGVAELTPYGVEVWGQSSDASPLLRAYDTVNIDEASSIHLTFPNGLPCRQTVDVGTLVNPGSTTSTCLKLDRTKEQPSSTTISNDIVYCPAVSVSFPVNVASEVNLTVTYGYAHQAALAP